MLKYFHHVIFDPLSAWEQFKLGEAFVVIVFLIMGLVRLIRYAYHHVKGAN